MRRSTGALISCISMLVGKGVVQVTLVRVLGFRRLGDHILPLDPVSKHPIHSVTDLYYAHGTFTSLLQARIHDTPVVIKLWRGASLSKRNRREFVEVCVSLSFSPFPHHFPLCIMILTLTCIYTAPFKRTRHMSRLSHPNIFPFLGLSPEFGQHLPALVLPFYENWNINDYITENPSVDKLGLVCAYLSPRLHFNSILTYSLDVT
jgi:hypothetical protein